MKQKKKWKLALAGLLCAVFAVTGNVSAQEPSLEEQSRQPGGQVLWETVTVEDGIDMYHRIPAITTANDGRLIAVSDKRYHNKNDLGNHQIDLVVRTSDDNGVSWTDAVNLTKGLSTSTTGYGDAAIVADRESDRVLIICVGGSAGYFGSNPNNRNNFYSFWSEDGGKNFTAPMDMTADIYGLDESWYGMFAGSGRIMQSRYIKVGEYYRIYTGISSRGSGNTSVNHVMYSDDFGETWHILGDTTVENAPVTPGDEPKVEELPNGDVVLSSRRDQGRYVNIFRYTKGDDTYTKGSWGSQGSFNLGSSRGCNGETYFLYAKHKESGRYVYLALQSLPIVNYRRQLGIFYKELTEEDSDPAVYATGWNMDKFFMVQQGEGGYSTFSIQKDGKLAFFYEEGNPYYDMVYVPLDLKTITGDAYEMAFPTGFGSKDHPYQVSAQDQVGALMDLYIRDEVEWGFTEECVPWIREAMTEKIQEAQTLYDTNGLEAAHPAAAALQAKITEAGEKNASDTATAAELFASCQAMVKAMDAYAEGDQLTEQLEAKIAEAEALYTEGALAETQEAAVALKAAADQAAEEKATATNAELLAMLTALTESMEEYEGVVAFSEELETLITEAEELLGTQKLSERRKEVVLLQEILAAAEAGLYQESADRLQEIRNLIEERMDDYEQAEVEEVSIEARYSSVHIRINALADITSYKIYRSEQEETGYQEVTTIEVTDRQTFYSYIDQSAGTGKHHWYKIEGIRAAGAASENYGPMQDLYATGIEAVQKHAQAEQYHADFISEGNLAFGGNRMAEATAEELARTAALGEGTVLVSFKPADLSGRKTLFAIKQSGASVSTSNLPANTGFVLYQLDNGVRVDASGSLISSWKNIAAVDQWLTFGIVNGVYDGTNPNVLTSADGNAKDRYGRSDMDGFLAKNPDLTSMTVGAGKNSGGPALYFNGEIAYVTVTDELFSQQELDDYTRALTGLLNSNLPAPGPVGGLRAEAEEDTVRLTWEAVAGEGIRYEVSMDGGTTWQPADSATGHSVTGLEEGREYTFQVRAYNVLIKGEAATVTCRIQGETPVEPVEQAAAPVFTPAAGTYTQAQQVEITSATPEAVIHYTTDGSEPAAESPVYTEAVTVDQDMVLKAIAVKEGMRNSTVASAAYRIQIPEPEKQTVTTPVISPGGGDFTKAQTVEISCETEGAVIYYTLDGSQPTAESQQYTGAITVSSSLTIKAIAVKEGMNDSATATAEFTITKAENPWIFTDVSQEDKGYWLYKAVRYVYNTTGKEGGTPLMGATGGGTQFEPGRPLDRAMLATILHRWAGEPAGDFYNKFTDVKSGYYVTAVLWANSKGIVNGKGGSSMYAPADPVSRAEIAKMLYEYGTKHLGLTLSQSGDLSMFADGKTVAGRWSEGYLKWATSAGIISGVTRDGKAYLDPDQPATRGQCAKMIQWFGENVIQ